MAGSMRTAMHRLVLTFIILLTYPLTVLGSSKVYISDELNVALRSGGGTEYRIIAFLKSGTPLIPLQTISDSKKEWSKVKTESGKEGWILNQYISLTAPAKNQLINAQKLLTELTEKSATANKSITEMSDKITQLEEERRLLNEQLHSSQTEYQRLRSVSEKTLQIDKANKQLNQELAMIKIRLEELTIENGQLKETQYVDGLTHGALAIIAGCFIGLMLPRLGGVKKRSNGWD